MASRGPVPPATHGCAPHPGSILRCLLPFPLHLATVRPHLYGQEQRLDKASNLELLYHESLLARGVITSRFLPHGCCSDGGRERPEARGASGTFRILRHPRGRHARAGDCKRWVATNTCRRGSSRGRSFPKVPLSPSVSEKNYETNRKRNARPGEWTEEACGVDRGGPLRPSRLLPEASLQSLSFVQNRSPAPRDVGGSRPGFCVVKGVCGGNPHPPDNKDTGNTGSYVLSI